MRPALLARARASRKSVVVGGLALGTPGAGIYSGMKLVDGDDFYTLDLVSPANPNGAYFTTRGICVPGGHLRIPPSGVLAVNVFVDPTYTGVADANRGVPIPYDGLGGTPPHSIVAGEGTGAIQLTTGRQSAAEKVLLNQGVSPERTATLASLGRVTFRAPCIIEARLKYPVGPAGWHPSFWNYTTQPNQGNIGNEYGFEGNSTSFNAYMDDHAGGSASVNTGTLQLAAGHDGNWHTFTVIQTLTYWSFLIDGTEVNRIGPGINFSGGNLSSSGLTPANHPLNDFFMLTNPAYNGTFLGETYSSGAWAAATAGASTTCEWWRVWTPTGSTFYQPRVSAGTGADQLFVAGQAFSVTLPPQTTLWGSTGLTENVIGLQVEVEEPGSNDTTGFDTTTGLPAWASYNSSTRVLSGTMPANSGRTHFKVEVVGQAGTACKPFRFRFDVAPVYTGATSIPFTNGTVGSNFDLYAAWDCGRLIGIAGGTAGKSLTATGLPTGMTLLSTGVISGTPTVNGTYSVTTTCTNISGQLTSATISMVVAAASTAVPAPTGLASATLTGSWDFNAGTSTVVSGKITQITGSDSTSNTLANASTGPSQITDTDGNGTARACALFVSTSSNYLKAASNLGILTSNAATLVVIAKANHASGNIGGTAMSFIDVAAGGAAFGANRHCILAGSGGFSHRKIDSSSVSSTATPGTAYSTTGTHCLIGRSPSGTAVGAIMNVGTGSNQVGGNSGQASGLNTTTVGATTELSAQTKFLDGTVFRILVYSNSLSDADQVLVKNWASTNYGTVAA